MIGQPGFHEGPSGPKIETIKMPSGDEVSYSPERGGIITSIKFQGTEILYLDNATFQDPKVSVKGGIPVLFPNAGSVHGSEFPNLEKHGFARNLKWKKQSFGNGFSQSVKADDNTRAIFQFDFKLIVGGQFNNDGSFSISQSVENTGGGNMPISMGLHPYFKVPRDAKKDIKFNFEGGKSVEENIKIWENGDAFFIDNPKVADPDAVMEIVIPSVGTITIDASAEYKRIWIWSLPGKDFVCIEPVMRDSGGLVNDPQTVSPGAVFLAEVKIKLEKQK